MPDVTAVSVPIGTVISYIGKLETANQLASPVRCGNPTEGLRYVELHGFA